MNDEIGHYPLARSTDESATTLKTVERALQVLEIVAASARLPRVRTVAKELGHNLSSTYNIVNTLIGAGYLTKDQTGGLRLDYKIGTLNAAFVRGTDFARELRPFADRLAGLCGETVYVTRRVGDRVVIQAVVESRQSLRVTGLEVGYSGNEDLRASGKAVLAFLPEGERARIEQRVWAGLAEAEQTARRLKLKSELAKVVRQGFAFDNEDFEVGVCCVAVPFFDSTGEAVGSATVSAPAVRLAQLKGPILDQVVCIASEISRHVGAPDHAIGLDDALSDTATDDLVAGGPVAGGSTSLQQADAAVGSL